MGLGLIFGTIAAPLLITELAYPTQVSCYTSNHEDITYAEFSVTNLHGCIISCGMWEALSVRDFLVFSVLFLRCLAAWTCLMAYDAAPNPTWSWQAPILGQALGPLLQVFFIWYVLSL